MTQEEIAKRIIANGTCHDDNAIRCSECPLHPPLCAYKVENAKRWLESHGGNMDKKAAIKRLDAIEEEAAKLREIIEKGDKIVYDEAGKTYVAIYDDYSYIMAGKKKSGFFFYRLYDSETSYSGPKPSAQECLDYHISKGFDIHVFDDTKEALQFFIDRI